MKWREDIFNSPALAALEEKVRTGGATSVRGATGSSTSIITAALGAKIKRVTVLAMAHLDEADEVIAEWQDLGCNAKRFPALESSVAESMLSADVFLERIKVADALERGAVELIVAPIAALMQRIPHSEKRKMLYRTLRVGSRVAPAELAAWLTARGYQRMEAVENPGEFSVRGGVFDVYPNAANVAVRLDFFGDDIEHMHEMDAATQANDRRIEFVDVLSCDEKQLTTDDGDMALADVLPRDALFVFAELGEVMEQARGYWERLDDSKGVIAPNDAVKGFMDRVGATLAFNQFSRTNEPASLEMPLRSLNLSESDTAKAFQALVEFSLESQVILLCSTDGDLLRTKELVRRHAPNSGVEVVRQHLHRGFCWEFQGQKSLMLIPEHELLGRFGVRRRAGSAAGSAAGPRARDAFLHFEKGDYVTHRDHGVAQYVGLVTRASLDRSGGVVQRASEGGDRANALLQNAAHPEMEYLTLQFEGGTKLHVPALRVDLVQKYVGAGASKPTLSQVGGKRWKAQKERVSEAVRDLAAEMLRVQAVRAATHGVAFPADTAWQYEFESAFPWEETADQLTAIAATKRDMEISKPMDRLICGDVGFGKTEVAIRAAFKCVESGRQVAVLVPTTLLAEQHERTFRDRFRAYPFRIESLSRFKSDAQQKIILEDLQAGRIDLVIGTHRLLSKDIQFSNLGLVVVDEEQRFGVEHKQRLLSFRATADVLTLSATPIPRTLHMSLLGLRDISSLTTPPADRRAIVTEVLAMSSKRLQQAIHRELAREGQIYYVHNRIRGLERAAQRIKALVPEARIEIGHGQMPSEQLEQVMLRFMRHECDVLVSTSIIESGIDNPRANTMFIDLADLHGLSDLHQLRGRVGRSNHRAYCYLFLPEGRPLTDDARRRLRAIEDYSMLGAGFRIAMRDLEIRGAGNLLGAQQSGHIAAVGYEMYCQLLEDAVDGLTARKKIRSADNVLDIGLAGAIPRGFIASERRRLEAYRRLSSADTLEVVLQAARDIENAYGKLPTTMQMLVDLAQLRVLLAACSVRSLVRRDLDYIFHTTQPVLLQRAFAKSQVTVRVVGKTDAQGLIDVYVRPSQSISDPNRMMKLLLTQLQKAVAL
ncbi:MAG: transcription-repair coupling factor [Phycisphaerales bacterium]|nr:transcription-repair coupling factor [Phycisphaerales bacterium]